MRGSRQRSEFSEHFQVMITNVLQRHWDRQENSEEKVAQDDVFGQFGREDHVRCSPAQHVSLRTFWRRRFAFGSCDTFDVAFSLKRTVAGGLCPAQAAVEARATVCSYGSCSLRSPQC